MEGKQAILASKHRDKTHPHNLRLLRNLLAKIEGGFRSFQSSRMNIPEKVLSFNIVSHSASDIASRSDASRIKGPFRIQSDLQNKHR